LVIFWSVPGEQPGGVPQAKAMSSHTKATSMRHQSHPEATLNQGMKKVVQRQLETASGDNYQLL
jgi:hypothetical protein